MSKLLLFRQKAWIIRRRIKDHFFRLFFSIIDIKMKRRGYILSLKGIKTLFYLPYIKRDLIPQQIYWKKNYFEKDELYSVCKSYNNGMIEREIRNSVVLDIGANIGNHTLYFLNECNAKFVYCFEPVADTFQILKKNIEINHLENRTKLMNVGVGKAAGKANVTSYTLDNTGMTTLALSDDGNIKIVSIDELEISDRVGLVKIDVEGLELDVIKGMISTIKRYKPYMMLEIQNSNFENINAILTELDYQFIVTGEEHHYKNYLYFSDFGIKTK